MNLRWFKLVACSLSVRSDQAMPSDQNRPIGSQNEMNSFVFYVGLAKTHCFFSPPFEGGGMGAGGGTKVCQGEAAAYDALEAGACMQLLAAAG